jgi:cytochrome c oxidase assembly protein subunit 15
LSKYSNFILITLLFAFIVIMLGAYTRLTNAGLSCPDWPHCFGFATAPHTPAQIEQAHLQFPSTIINTVKAQTEMTHRYVAGTEGILIIALSLSLLLVPAQRQIIPALILFILLGTQVTLGMLTVTEKLKPVIVLSHLLVGISIMSVLWWAYLASKKNRTKLSSINTLSPIWFWLGFILLAAQITLGGWVSTHSASLACIDFPYCNGELLPTLHWSQLNTDLITIHMLHRLGALLTASYLLFLAFYLLRTTSYRALGTFILILLTIQMTLGILNIIWLRPVSLALLHQAVAIFLLLTLLTGLKKISHEHFAS